MNPVPNLESRLPEWARRNNAHVQRQLNFTGHPGSLNVQRLVMLFIIQAALIILSLPLSSLLDMQLPFTPIMLLLMPIFVLPYSLGLTSIIVLPILLPTYGRVLFDVAHAANDNMFAERRQDTLTLIRITPPSLREILLSQIAGNIWRQIENIDIILVGIAAFSLPPIVLNHMMAWPTDNPLGARLWIIVALAVSLLRPLPELFMAGALGTLSGMTTSFRVAGITWTTILLGLYFIFLNAPRLLSLSMPVRILVEVILPLLLPVLLTWGALAITEKLICQD